MANDVKHRTARLIIKRNLPAHPSQRLVGRPGGRVLRRTLYGLGAILVASGTMPRADASGQMPRRQFAGGSEQPAVFSADEVTYDDALGVVTARGKVEISEGDRTLLADVVSYNQRSDTVTATGHVSMLQPSGDTVFGDYVELTDHMRDGFIKDVRLLMADRSRLAGNTGRRTNGNRVELRRGVYSPCDLCAKDPLAPPLWQLKAAKIIHDEVAKQVEYRDVELDMAGYPVLYSPYLSHPDPSVKRATGLLPPSFGSSNVLGANITLPYFWVLGPSADFTFSPVITSDQGPVLAGEYRQRFANGYLTGFGSITNSNSNTNPNLPGSTGPNQIRGNIFTQGAFDIDSNFRAGWNIQRATDQTYLQVYHYGGTQAFLPANVFLEDFSGRDYGSVNALSFQALSQGATDRQQAIALPLAQYTWAGRPLDWGGRFTTTANALELIRQTGPNSRRVSLGTEMDLPLSAPLGQKLNFLVALRGDGYDVGDQPLGGTGRLVSGTDGRVFPQTGLEWRDPWVRQDSNSHIVIEPRLAFYAAPVGLNPAKIPNDDSLDFSYSASDLFTRNRPVGYDLVDSGQRVDYGLDGGWYGNSGSTAEFLLGQSYRLQQDSGFGIGSGLERQSSDYVGELKAAPSRLFSVNYDFRFDEHDLRPHRQQITAVTGPETARLTVGYLQLGDNPSEGVIRQQQISAQFDLRLTEYWSLTGRGTRNMSNAEASLTPNVSSQLASAFGVQYNDECFTFAGTLSQNGTRYRDISPGSTLLFQVVFKNLGEINLPALQTGFAAAPL